MQKLKALRTGDMIEIVSPAYWVDRALIDLARSLLEARGFKVKVSDQSYQQYGAFAGSIIDRANAINQAFSNKEVKAILCARGGYGSAQILDCLDIDLIKQNPKIFIGYSDVSCLLNYIAGECSFPIFHGPMVVDLLQQDQEKWLNNFVSCFSDGRTVFADYEPQRGAVLQEGIAKALVFGGNLSFSGFLGTKYMPELSGSILLLEEVDEPLYQIDKILNQMQLSGYLKGINGVVVGRAVGLSNEKYIIEDSEESLYIKYLIGKAGVAGPVLMDAPFSHHKDSKIIPLGCPIQLDVSKERIKISLVEDIFN